MHPRVFKAYSNAGFDPTDYTSVQDKVIQEFRRATQGSDTKKRIDQVYRVKKGAKDFIFYNVTEIGTDLPGNEQTCSYTVGYYDKPVFNQQYQRDGTVIATSIAKTERVYEIPFSRKNLQRILDSATIESEPVFTLILGSAKHGDFTKEEFLERHIDDLSEKVTTGRLPTEKKPLRSDAEVEQEMREFRKRADAENEKKPRSGRRTLEEELSVGGLEEDDEPSEEVAKAYGAEPEKSETADSAADEKPERRTTTRKQGRRR
jgi:hypothetical protein